MKLEYNPKCREGRKDQLKKGQTEIWSSQLLMLLLMASTVVLRLLRPSPNQLIIIIEPNFWYGEPISEVQKIFPGEDAEKIVSIPNAIKVYDDYIE